MHRWTRKLCVLVAPTLLLSLTLLGCSGSDKDGKPKKKETPSNNDDSGDAAGAKKPVKGTGTGTITGTVTFEGSEPDIADLNAKLLAEIDKLTAEKKMCLEGGKSETTAFQWRINPKNKGLKNVFVWIKPLKDNEFFDVSDLVKKNEGFNKEVKLDQPHCAFIPHAFVLFQRYVDPKNPDKSLSKQPETGQKFIIANSAPRPHNTKEEGGKNVLKGVNKVIDPGKDEKIEDIMPSYTNGVTFSCSIHPWMRAYAWSFDHPFAAVTDADGKYKIENVPAGVKVRIVAWHEEAKFLNGNDGEELDVKSSGTTKDFKAKK